VKLPAVADATKMVRQGRIQELADAGTNAVAATNDVRELRELSDRLGKIKKIVGTVTSNRVDINKIAVPMVKAAVKGGRLLSAMDLAGRPKKRSPRVTISQLGFTKQRSSKWQLAGEMSDEQIEAAKDRILQLDDEIWGLNFLLRAARLARRNAKREKLKAIFSDDGPFGTVVIDPPWQVEKIDRDVRANQAEFAYDTMTETEIIAFWNKNIAQRIEPDCHLFMWVTNKLLPASFKIIDILNFRYVLTMVWHKDGGFQPIGLPQYNCEFVVYARQGAPTFVDTKNFFCCFDGARREHSRKPIEFYDLIRRVTGGSRIDVFSRESHEGFAQYGNELRKFAAEDVS